MVEAQEARAVQTGGAVAASAPPPLPAGWSGATMAVHAVRRMPALMLVTLQPAGRSPIVIDMRAYVYAWDEPLDALPVDPEHVQIGTRAIRDAEPVFAGDDYVEHAPVITGVALEPLLWLIGFASAEQLLSITGRMIVLMPLSQWFHYRRLRKRLGI